MTGNYAQIENYAQAEALRLSLLEQGYDEKQLVPIYYKNKLCAYYVFEDDSKDLSLTERVEKYNLFDRFDDTKQHAVPVLINPELKDIDPRDENLTSEQKMMILNECKDNIMYFFSVVSGTPIEEVAKKFMGYERIFSFSLRDKSSVTTDPIPRPYMEPNVAKPIRGGYYGTMMYFTAHDDLLESTLRPWCYGFWSNRGSYNPYQYYEDQLRHDPEYIKLCIRAYLKNSKYYLDKPRVDKITPDMIHYPDDWVPSRKPWEEEVTISNRSNWTWYGQNNKKIPNYNGNESMKHVNRKEKII